MIITYYVVVDIYIIHFLIIFVFSFNIKLQVTYVFCYFTIIILKIFNYDYNYKKNLLHKAFIFRNTLGHII